MYELCKDKKKASETVIEAARSSINRKVTMVEEELFPCSEELKEI